MLQDQSNKKENIGDSILNKKEFGYLVQVDNLKDQKHLKPCDPKLEVDEIPVLRIKNNKPLKNKGLYITSSHRDKTYLYTPKDLKLPLCYLSKKKQKRLNKLNKTQRRKAKQNLVEELAIKESEEKEAQKLKNEERRLKLIEDKKLRDEKRLKLKQERDARKQARKDVLKNLKDQKFDELKKLKEIENKNSLDNYYNLTEKLEQLVELLKKGNEIQRYELKVKLVYLYFLIHFKFNKINVKEKRKMYNDYINLLLLKVNINLNRYLVKLYSKSNEIHNILKKKEFEEEINSYIDKQELFLELNKFYLDIYFLYKSNLNFFEKSKKNKYLYEYEELSKTLQKKNEKTSSVSTLKSIPSSSLTKLNFKTRFSPGQFGGRSQFDQQKQSKLIGYYIFKKVIEPLKNTRYTLRSYSTDMEDKDYIIKELNKYNTVLKLLNIQKDMVTLSDELSKKVIDKKSSIKILNLSITDKESIEEEIKYYKEELNDINKAYNSIFSKIINEEQEELKEEAELN